MKKIFLKYRLTIIACLSILILTSCDDWLDVKPKTEMDAEEMFSTEEGFKGALAGVYTAMNQPSLYGREMTYGMVDAVSQQWKVSSFHKYADAIDYEYESVKIKGTFDQLWVDMYNAIANANSILAYIDQSTTTFTGNNRNIIKGETLAIRAYLHFDILRLFGGVDVNDSSEDGIPYVDHLTKRITPSVSPKKVIENILIDLKEAAKYLEEDPILTGQNVTTGDDQGYLINRKYHLNYYAVIGLMARVELYAENLPEAKRNAQIVIDAHNNNNVFEWGKSVDVVNPKPELRDRTISSEHLFALNIRKLTDYIDGYFMGTDNPLLTRINKETLFGGVEDYRKNFFETMNYVGDVPSKLWQMKGAVVNGVLIMPKRDRMPMIKLSEMYYIVAESNKNNPESAVPYINEVLAHRGYQPSELLDPAIVNTPEAVQGALLKEYQREFIAEGQLFYYHKRMNDLQINNKSVNYVFPKPELELEFGQ